MAAGIVDRVGREDATTARFSWPMRVFLAASVLFILVRSFTDDPAWIDEACGPLAVEHYPDSGAAIPGYLIPWPSAESRGRIESPADGMRYGLCWMGTRSDFVENLLGTNQQWKVFVGIETTKVMARAELVYSDGTRTTVRQLADVEDRTSYSHWWRDKIMNPGLYCMDEAPIYCASYCSYLASTHRVSPGGARLERIILRNLRWNIPAPGVDPVSFLEAQSAQQEALLEAPFYEYDVERRTGRVLP